jgi:glutamate/aspartate transport system permease protein
MTYSWNWSVLLTSPYSGWLLQGTAWTLALFVTASIIGFSIGTLIGLGRIAPLGPLRMLSGAYVQLFRNIPLLVQFFLWFYVLPELLPGNAGQWLKRDLPMPEFWTATLAVGLYSAARIAEHIRSGFASIPQRQTEAALATGLSLLQVYRYVLLPRAFRTVIPAITSEAISIMKNTSLALTVGVLELMAQARQIESYTFQSFEAYTACLVIYMVLCSAIVFVARRLEALYAIPGMIRGH